MKTKSLAFTLTCLLLSCFAVPVLACCLPPQPPCYRCEDGVWVWNCSSGQSCCGGTCYNPATQKCCTDPSPYLCSSDQTCCKGNCCNPSLCYDCNSTTGECEYRCKNWQCCINGNCVDGICSGCFTVAFAFFECYHEANDVNCATDRCIANVLNTASCWWKGADWPCKKVKCDTKEDFWGDPEVTQYVIENEYVTCPGGVVEYELLYMLWQGCDLCLPKLGLVSCMTTLSNCPGAPEDPAGIGVKKVCGCD